VGWVGGVLGDLCMGEFGLFLRGCGGVFGFLGNGVGCFVVGDVLKLGHMRKERRVAGQEKLSFKINFEKKEILGESEGEAICRVKTSMSNF